MSSTTTTTLLCVASVFVLTLILFPLDVSAIWCFQCNSQFDQECATIQPNDTSSPFYRQCTDDDQSRRFNGSKEFFCRKISQTIYDREGLVRVIRRCGWVQHKLPCYSYDTEGHKDIVCQCFTDACNSAFSLRNAWPTGILSAVIVLIVQSLR